MSIEQQQILDALSEIEKKLATSGESLGILAAFIQNTLAETQTIITTRNTELAKAEAEIKKLKNRDVKMRMGVASGLLILLALLPGFVIRWPLTSGQAAVLCSVVICGSLLGIVYFVTGRQRDRDD
jgi:hypothetical protein